MAMGAHGDRQAVDLGIEVGAMVEVETAQELLVGFALTTVLRDDQSGDELQQFSAAGDWALGELLSGHKPFRRRSRCILQPRFALDVNRVEDYGNATGRHHKDRTQQANQQRKSETRGWFHLGHLGQIWAGIVRNLPPLSSLGPLPCRPPLRFHECPW